MALSRRLGISIEKYKEVQGMKEEEDFKNNTNKRIQDLERHLIAVKESLLKLDALQCSDKTNQDIQVNHIMDSCMDSLKEFRQNIGDLSSQLNSLKKQLDDIRKSLEGYSTFSATSFQFNVLKDSIDSIKKDNEKREEGFRDEVRRNVANFSELLKKQKDEILSIPSEIPPIKKLLEQKIELVELNGQNAVLRSSNNEKQIMLVERKIENIYQLIKKFDLSNQESK